MDTLSEQQRSVRMARIRGQDTAPELIVRRYLHREGFRYRLHPRDLPGRPDIVLPRFRTVVFVQGCFWHGHDCSIGHVPKSRSEFWRAKFEANRARDRRNNVLLAEMGWHIIELWECELTRKAERDRILSLVASRIRRDG